MMKVPNSKGYRINVCAAVSPTFGLVAYEAVVGQTYDAARFRDFMHKLIHKNLFTQHRSFYFVMDNVRFHKSEIVMEVLSGARIRH